MDSQQLHQLIDPYGSNAMIAKFKGCINDFKSLEATENNISSQLKDFQNRRIKILVKAIVCYVKWVATVRNDYPNLNQQEHLISPKKNKELTKILYFNSIHGKDSLANSKIVLSQQTGYRKCKNFVNLMTTAVNYILQEDDFNYYNFITSSSSTDNVIETLLIENSEFLMKTSLKCSIVDKPTFKCIEYDEEKEVIDDNRDDDDDGADQTQYLVENKLIYPFQGSKVVNKVTNYFESLHGETFKCGTSSLGDFKGVDGMWRTSVITEIASVLNDVFRNHTGDIHGIDFGHGSALTIFVLLESLNSTQFNMIGLEVCSLYIIYYFSFS